MQAGSATGEQSAEAVEMLQAADERCMQKVVVSGGQHNNWLVTIFPVTGLACYATSSSCLAPNFIPTLFLDMVWLFHLPFNMMHRLG